ncbi:MAG: response regulator [Pseudobutyrivibrio sp.]|nr:response regulator [Pseudobutyrivibrio sp.]
MNQAAKALRLIYLFLLFLTLLVVISYSIHPGTTKSGIDLGHAIEFDNGWVNAATGENVEIPSTGIADKFTIENTLPSDIKNSDFLFLFLSSQDVVVRINDKEIYSHFFSTQSLINKEFGPMEYVSIPLKEVYSGKKISIDYSTNLPSDPITIVGRIYVGDKANIIFRIIKVDAISILGSFVLFVIGVVCIARYFANYKNDTNFTVIRFLYRGISMLMVSFWFILQTRTIQLLFNDMMLLRDLDFISQLLIPIPFVLTINELEENKYQKATLILCLAESIGYVFLFLATFTGISDFHRLVNLIDVPLNLTIVYSAITIFLIFLSDKELFHRIRYNLLTLLVVVICGILEILGQNNYIVVKGVFLPIGAIIFCVAWETLESKSFENAKATKIEFGAYKKSQKLLLASVSHEIRTPINAILGMDEMILRSTHDETVVDYALNIQMAGDTLLSLVNDILDFSKIESGKMEVIPEEYSFSSMINDLYILSKVKADAKGLKLNFDIDENIPDKLFGDPLRIKQVLINILYNAIKYTNYGSVTLSVKINSLDCDFVCLDIHIIDTGIGIKPEDINKIYNPYERIDEKNNRNIAGTGLGLSIVNSLLTMMDSELQVTSKYKSGSDFSFLLVQDVVDSKKMGKFTGETDKQKFTDYKVSFKAPEANILVVDDTDMNLKVFCGLLKDTDMQIDTASTAKEAIFMCTRKKYDIIFMDQQMPVMDGTDTMKEIKSALSCEINANTPFVILTANTVSGAKEQFLANGFVDYVAKPIDSKKLEAITKNLLPKDKIIQ